MTYYTTDMVAGQTQATATCSWTLDPAARLRQATASGTGTRLNHYDDPSSDSPAWTDENTGAATLSATRYVAGLDGNLAAVITYTGATSSARWQLGNLHGDIVTSAADDPTLTTPDGPTLDADEFGTPRGTSARYGWLGQKQRETDDLTGLTLMGVRLYAPTLGRFLQVDPVEGGSANDYDYANQDPVNAFDLDGRRCWSCWRLGLRYGLRHRARIRWAARIFHRHFNYSWGVCGVLCGGVSYGHGRLYAYRGCCGLAAWGSSFGWTSARPEHQAKRSWQICGYYRAGGCYMHGRRSRRGSRGMWRGGSVGAGYGGMVGHMYSTRITWGGVRRAWRRFWRY